MEVDCRKKGQKGYGGALAQRKWALYWLFAAAYPWARHNTALVRRAVLRGWGVWRAEVGNGGRSRGIGEDRRGDRGSFNLVIIFLLLLLHFTYQHYWYWWWSDLSFSAQIHSLPFHFPQRNHPRNFDPTLSQTAFVDAPIYACIPTNIICPINWTRSKPSPKSSVSARTT